MYLRKNKNVIAIILVFFLLLIFMFILGSYLMNKRIFPFNYDGYLRKVFTSENLEKNKYWADKIIDGGYILFFRHAQREKWNDIVTAYDAHELANRIEARGSWFERAVCLTPRGIKDSKLIGIVFEHSGIKINQIFSSPSCRSRETAMFAFNRIDKYYPSILHPTAINNEEYPIMAKRLKKVLLNMETKKGYNNIISGHSNTLDKYYTLVLDKHDLPPARRMMNISEGGFHVLEVDKEENKIYYRHMFKDFRDFALQVYELADIKPSSSFPLN